MTSFGLSVFIGVGLVVLGSIFTWNNEANQVCTAGAYQVASANTFELQTCSINEKQLNSFMHLTCPVEESLITSEPFTGISGSGAYKLTFLTEQYGYTFTSETQNKRQCDKNGDCVEKVESCKCLKLGWTTVPESQTTIDNFYGTWCDSCKSNLNETSIPNEQYLLTDPVEPAAVSEGDEAVDSFNNWLQQHPEVVKAGWEWSDHWDWMNTTTYSIFILERPFTWGHSPPTELGYTEKYTDHILLGDGSLQIDGKDISKIRNQQLVPITNKPATIAQNSFILTTSTLCGKAKGSSTACYYSPNVRNFGEQINTDTFDLNPGDMRMLVEAFGSDNISVLGKVVKGNSDSDAATIVAASFGESKMPPCKASSLFYISNGKRSASEIYEILQNGLKTQTTMFRVMTFLLVGFGFYVALSPLTKTTEVSAKIPIIGSSIASLMSFLVLLVATLLTSAVWFTVFAIAWVFYRPLYGMLFLLIAGCFCFGAYRSYNWLRKKSNQDPVNQAESNEKDALNEETEPKEIMMREIV